MPSDAAAVGAWLTAMREQGLSPRFVAMDNEPELWGFTHYDVYPDCTTYSTILEKHLEYASMVRAVMPETEITGPVTCCWYYYWNSAAGVPDKLRHGNQDFLPWFLSEVRKHDQQNDVRTLDVLDIHYYPADLYNDDADEQTAAHRLRATRSLWDRSYRDESWIDEPIYLIPRMKELIDANYPGLKLGVSEWNFGAEETINGALAIADVLGIFGREDLYMASYWTYPPLNSPGHFAFKMYTNYDGNGGRFGETAVYAQSSDESSVTVYAAQDSSGTQTHLMLINKDPQRALSVGLDLVGIAPETATMFRYSDTVPDRIVEELADLSTSTLVLPAYSITHLVLQGIKDGRVVAKQPLGYTSFASC
ncbi:hypothetical protein HC891_22040 [Candidatus Gracilibacteria bacterium]|nr:hypothetical protein [Candidatus Gracilibacteria bacterium]